MNTGLTYRLSVLFVVILFAGVAYSQSDSVSRNLPLPPIDEKNWGPNDTIITGAIYYNNEWLPYRELETAWVSKMNERKLARYIKEWTRLRNAVYVTYPYARTAGFLMNDINAHLSVYKNKKEKKKYLKTREKELKDQFADPLSQLSVYQGKILMKLINRQTGNNCYEIVKDYRGGFTARFYQTVAFFFGSNLKQEWDLKESVDRLIESFVREIDAGWYNPVYSPGTH